MRIEFITSSSIINVKWRKRAYSVVMAAPGRLSLSGAPCSERFEDRDEAFRKLLCDVSQHLHEEDVQQMECITDLPGRAKNGLDLLMELHKRGRFSPKRTEPLSSLLRDVNRHDLAEKLVDEYLTTYPDVEDDPVPHAPLSRSRHSLPPSASPRIVPRMKRANTETNASLPGTPKIVVDHSTASSPDRSHHYLRDEGNRSDTERHHSRQSSLANNIHIHLHLPQSHSSESLPSAPGRGQGAKSPRSRLRSAPEQDMRKVCPPPRARAFSIPSYTNGYLQSEEHGVNCSSEQLQTSIFESEECVNSEESPLTLLIDRSREQGKGGRPEEHRGRLDDTVTPDTPGVSSVDKNHDSGKHDQEEETIKETSQALGNAHHKPKNRTQKIFQRLWPSRKSEPRTTLSWTILREEVSEMVWKHKEQGCVQCPEQLQVDARCGDNDPHLLFRLYPYGLFEDKGKNMTLFVKINIPDDCLPIHPSTKLHLTVRVCAVEGKERKQLHVHQLEPKVNSCVLYIPKIMSHKELQKIHCKEFDIRIFTSTG